MKVSVCKEEFEQTGLVEIALTCGHVVILASESGSPQISHKIEICYFFMPSLCYRRLGMRVYMNKPYLILLQNFLFH